MNIILNKFTATDFEDYYRLVSDERVMAMITERAIPLEEAKIDFEHELKKIPYTPILVSLKSSMKKIILLLVWQNWKLKHQKAKKRNWDI